MLELFKGQLSLDDIRKNMSYREALLLREVRVERLKEEAKEAKLQREADERKMNSK